MLSMLKPVALSEEEEERHHHSLSMQFENTIFFTQNFLSLNSFAWTPDSKFIQPLASQSNQLI